MYHEMSCNRFMHRCKELFYFTNVTEIKYCLGGFVLNSCKLNTLLKYISNVLVLTILKSTDYIFLHYQLVRRWSATR